MYRAWNAIRATNSHKEAEWRESERERAMDPIFERPQFSWSFAIGLGKFPPFFYQAYCNTVSPCWVLPAQSRPATGKSLCAPALLPTNRCDWLTEPCPSRDLVSRLALREICPSTQVRTRETVTFLLTCTHFSEFRQLLASPWQSYMKLASLAHISSKLSCKWPPGAHLSTQGAISSWIVSLPPYVLIRESQSLTPPYFSSWPLYC
jgi:hypothetical protein